MKHQVKALGDNAGDMAKIYTTAYHAGAELAHDLAKPDKIENNEKKRNHKILQEFNYFYKNHKQYPEEFVAKAYLKGFSDIFQDTKTIDDFA